MQVWFSPVAPQEAEMLSEFASGIVRRHFDLLIGTAQNDYMIAKFQAPEAIRQQLASGYQYYWVRADGETAGFLAFYPRDGKLYLSKFYLAEAFRGKHLARRMLDFIVSAAKAAALPAIFLNVNRDNAQVIAIYEHLGFVKVREEKNDIGGGFFMDDYVLEYACR